MYFGILYCDYYSKDDAIPSFVCWVVFLCSKNLPEDGFPMPKHLEFNAYYELYFIKCIFLLIY
jgi:hypothetical protein